MSDYLQSLLQRSREPIREAVRPLPRARFEPDVGAFPVSTEAGGVEEVERARGDGEFVGVPGAPLGGTRSRADRTAGLPARAPRRDAEETAPMVDSSASRDAMPRPPRIVVEPERTIVVEASGSYGAAREASTGARKTPAAAAGTGRGLRGTSPEAPSAAPRPVSPGVAEPPRPLPTQLPAPVVQATSESSTPAGRSRPVAAREGAAPTVAAPERPGATPPAQEASPRQGRKPLEIGRLRPLRTVNDSQPTASERREETLTGASEQPPVVRVTIGRVEVRAVAAPARPAPAPAPRPRSPTLALGDYLAQRNEGRR